MQNDLMNDMGSLLVGSRLKRLAERLQADAAAIHKDVGEQIQPGQCGLFAAVDRYGPLSVKQAAQALQISQPSVTRAANDLVKLGLVQTDTDDADKRQRNIQLTDHGTRTSERLQNDVWKRLRDSMDEVLDGVSGDFLSQLSAIEARLDQRSLLERARSKALEIVPYTPELGETFGRINREWIEAMFVLEDHDREVLSDPQKHIIDKGGDILFVRSPGLGIVGACALCPAKDGYTELTKMGVTKAARGQKAGEFLLRAVIDHAVENGMADRLYLATNAKCRAAIHLYEKLGFQHDEEIRHLFGSCYDRCDVAMRFDPAAYSAA